MRIRPTPSLYIAGLILILAAVTPARAADAPARELDGSWTIVAMEKGGQKAPKEALERIGQARTVIANDTLKVMMADKPLMEGQLTLDPKASPKTFDLRGKDARGKEVVNLGIYELAPDGRLRWCFAAAKRPASFDTAKEPGAQLNVYERAK